MTNATTISTTAATPASGFHRVDIPSTPFVAGLARSFFAAPDARARRCQRPDSGEKGGSPLFSGCFDVREVLGKMLAQDVADPAALVLRGDAQAHEERLLALG